MSDYQRQPMTGVASFLETSRQHFGLPERRSPARLPNTLGSMLLAGSLLGAGGMSGLEYRIQRPDLNPVEAGARPAENGNPPVLSERMP